MINSVKSHESNDNKVEILDDLSKDNIQKYFIYQFFILIFPPAWKMILFE